MKKINFIFEAGEKFILHEMLIASNSRFSGHLPLDAFNSLVEMVHEDCSLFLNESESELLAAEITQRLLLLSLVPQNETWHPEGNVFRHTFLVRKNLNEIAKKHLLTPREFFILAMSAWFHDFGKLETLNFSDKGNPTAHGHEEESAKLVDQITEKFNLQSSEFITIRAMVDNHMRIHVLPEMSKKKRVKLQTKMENLKAWELLHHFQWMDANGKNASEEDQFFFEDVELVAKRIIHQHLRVNK